MFNFTKMHGLGNDYVFVDCTNSKNIINNPANLSRIISNRNFGIGSDGLILIEKSSIADFKMRIFNSDGSEAEMCGNGIRCVGKYVFDNNLTTKTSLKIETLAGIKQVDLKVKNNIVYSASVCVGKYEVKNPIQLQINDKNYTVFPATVGNPHAIIFSNNLDLSEFEKYAPIIETNSAFPNKTNVEFVKVSNANLIRVLVWERGSGKTLACGTGAAAVTAVCYTQKLVPNLTSVELPGGTLKTYVDSSNNVYISGPATTVFSGTYYN